MKLTINGTDRTITATTVQKILEEELKLTLTPEGTAENGSKLGIAVALNDTVVPRSQWHSRKPVEGDRLEIITAVQGG